MPDLRYSMMMSGVVPVSPSSQRIAVLDRFLVLVWIVRPKANVSCCLVNTEHFEEFDLSLKLAEDYPGFCIPCAGVHPVQYEKEGDFVARSANLNDLTGVPEWFEQNHGNLVAIGEVGLDFTPRYIKGEEDKPIQKEVMKHQIELGRKYDLPLICHSRSAGAPIIKLLIESNAQNVLLHAFDGSKKSAMPGVKAGFHFSIPPCVVRSDQKKSLIENVPIEQLLLETDSPVLGPSKDERNVPSNIRISAEAIAAIKKLDVDTVIRITTENAHRLFPKLKGFLK